MRGHAAKLGGQLRIEDIDNIHGDRVVLVGARRHVELDHPVFDRLLFKEAARRHHSAAQKHEEKSPTPVSTPRAKKRCSNTKVQNSALQTCGYELHIQFLSLSISLA